MITKGQIQVCNRLKAEGSSFVDLHSSIFGLYLKYFIHLKVLQLGEHCPRCSLWLRVWWQPYSDCRLQTSAGIRD